MSDEHAGATRINLIRADDGRWRVIINGADMGVAYQFPWDALQCAINGALTGKPLRHLQTIQVTASTSADEQSLSRIRAADARHKGLLSSLRGIDGEGI
ncbi:MAG TPA: hypothetical protein VF507_04060 [Pyrinomonadaceae bacterium]|jgi:hypothetical protein